MLHAMTLDQGLAPQGWRARGASARWLGALENAAGIDANLTPRICHAYPVAHQPAGRCSDVPKKSPRSSKFQIGVPSMASSVNEYKAKAL
jgi:hypothetical protein